MHLKFGAGTDPGRVRTNNEDRYVADADLRFFAVIDGMGGHAGGEMASATIAEAATSFIRETTVDSDKTWPATLDPRLSDLANRLQVAVHSANKTLASRVKENAALEGGGATLAAALFGDGVLAVCNVGDCRAYLLRGGRLSQMTRDHSVVAEQLEQGIIDAEAARTHPLRHVVTRAVSGQPDMAVDVHEMEPSAGDRLVLCSDGVHGVLTDAELATLVSAPGQSLDEICRAILDTTNARGGPDNATAVIVEMVPSDAE
ncbi:MAG: protein phosphatase 2C domain-containing protein [Acidobacteria bacterium]|nr:protein phosphatase 2C domain-containing protein [Acidobacteriota bacterium]